MFFGLTIGHLTRPQRPFRVAIFLEILARASVCLTSELPAFWATVLISVGSPMLLIASIILFTLSRMAFSVCSLAKPMAWKKWSLSSITAMCGLRLAKKATRAWSVRELFLLRRALMSLILATLPIS